jgi:hypothetical protein
MYNHFNNYNKKIIIIILFKSKLFILIKKFLNETKNLNNKINLENLENKLK